MTNDQDTVFRGQDLCGQRFGRWIVLNFSHVSDKPYWLCRCDCGTERLVGAGNLKRGGSKSCGCLRSEVSRQRVFKHGCAVPGKITPEFKTWCVIRRRCGDKNFRDYPNYGGRGIAVCERWRESFENFLADMGCKPTLKHSIDRIDNDGNYEPGNCRWSTQKQQCRNQRRNRLITYNGATKTLAEWAEILGVTHAPLRERIDRWGVALAMQMPKGGFRRKP